VDRVGAAPDLLKGGENFADSSPPAFASLPTSRFPLARRFPETVFDAVLGRFCMENAAFVLKTLDFAIKNLLNVRDCPLADRMQVKRLPGANPEAAGPSCDTGTLETAGFPAQHSKRRS